MLEEERLSQNTVQKKVGDHRSNVKFLVKLRMMSFVNSLSAPCFPVIISP